MKKLISLSILSVGIISLWGSLIICPNAQAAPKEERVLFLFASPLSGGYAFLGQRELWAGRDCHRPYQSHGGH